MNKQQTNTPQSANPAANPADNPAARRKIGADTCGPLAFGCWRFTDPDIAKATQLLETALECDMNLLDTADVYGMDFGGSGFGDSETILGNVFARSPGLREKFLLATKGGITPPVPYNSSKKHLIQACEDSLQRLQVDMVDLYQIHRPDFYAHPAEVAEALESLQRSGKIRYIGISNYTPSQADALAECLSEPMATTQPEYSAATLSPMFDGTLDRCMSRGITPLAWSPLAGGRLATGEGVRPELIEVLDRLAEREGADRTAVAIAFVLAHPSQPVAIMGTTRPERLNDSTQALKVELGRSDCYEIMTASMGEPLP